MNKNILLASFIFPERLEWFLSYLEAKFEIKRDEVFVFENLDDESKLMVTFKFVIPQNRRVNFKNLFPNAILIHKRGGAIYTINALNKLIEEISGNSVGNIDYKSIRIDWDEYQDKLLLISGDNLNISNIKRVF